MRGPLNLKFANHFIIYQKRPFRGRFGTGRLHSELWDWGVKTKLTEILVLWSQLFLMMRNHFFSLVH